MGESSENIRNTHFWVIFLEKLDLVGFRVAMVPNLSLSLVLFGLGWIEGVVSKLQTIIPRFISWLGDLQVISWDNSIRISDIPWFQVSWFLRCSGVVFGGLESGVIVKRCAWDSNTVPKSSSLTTVVCPLFTNFHFGVRSLEIWCSFFPCIFWV